MRLPGIAPGLPPWRGGILLLNHNREIKRAESVLTLPAHAISTKNKHLLAIYSIPTRGFTAAVSVFRGTPPPKPSNCKIQCGHSGALIDDWRAEPTGEGPRPFHAVLVLVSIRIFKMPLSSYSQCFAFRYRICGSVFHRKTKSPASGRVSRADNSKIFYSRHLPTEGLSGLG